jgi:hypothetical protein
MTAIKIFLSVALGLIVWLFIGGPSVKDAGNLIISIVVIFHLFVVIWSGPIFRIFKGDEFTYGMVTLGINILSLLYTMITAAVLLAIYGNSINDLNAVPKYIWAFMFLGVIFSVMIPMLTTSDVRPLPKKESRREFEPPKFD